MEFLRLKVRTTADLNLNRSLGELYKELFGKNPPKGSRNGMPLGDPRTLMFLHMRAFSPEAPDSLDALLPLAGAAICYRHGWREP